MEISKVLNGEVKWSNPQNIPLLRCSRKSQLAVVPTGAGVGVYVHWARELARTQPCLIHLCPWCPNGDPRRPLSYIPVMAFTTKGGEAGWRRAILEVPHSTGKVLSGMLGKVVALRRDREFGPVMIGTFFFECDPVPVEKFDMWPLLLNLWRIQPGQAIALIGNLGPSRD